MINLFHKILKKISRHAPRWLAIIAVLVAVLAISGGAYYTAVAAKLGAVVFPQSTKIYDRNGALLYELYGEVKRTPVDLAQIPLPLQKATIATEDKDFYNHIGISPLGILRAAWANLKSQSLGQGGSTISQQLVRGTMLTREKSFSRKIKEVFLSVALERRHSKDEILEMYLNSAPYGANAYGAESASETFFGKPASKLTLAESAYLAALPKAPTYYSPYGAHRDKLDARAHLVLALMKEQGYISDAEFDAAQKEEVRFRKITTTISAPHFVMYVLDGLRQRYGEAALLQSGLEVRTTLDLKLQTLAEDVVAKRVPANEKNYRAGNAALVAIDPRSGEILAMVGSRDYFDEAHDGAVNVATSPRQPGSSFKPYVYAAAFKNGMSPATMLMDLSTNFGNYGGSVHGPVSMRQALAGSLNIPAVKTIMLTGIDKSIDTAESMGITTLKDRERYGPSLVLGGGEVTLLEHTSAFGVFANTGIRHETLNILEIRDSHGNILEQARTDESQAVLDPAIAYQITDVLSDNQARQFIFGSLSGNLALSGRTAAAKTGTTENFHDAWTIGYTPSLVTGVWVGNSDNAAMRPGADGSVVAAPIWNEFMRRALQNTPAEKFARPSGIIQVAVDSVSGLLPTEHTPQTKMEIFAANNVPTKRDNVHVQMEIDGEMQVVTVFHSEQPGNASWEAPVVAWAQSHNYYPFLPAKEPVLPDPDSAIAIAPATETPVLPENQPALGGVETNQYFLVAEELLKKRFSKKN